jgi:hypothetical protein
VRGPRARARRLPPTQTLSRSLADDPEVQAVLRDFNAHLARPPAVASAKLHQVDHVQKLLQFAAARSDARTESQRAFEDSTEFRHLCQARDATHALRRDELTQFTEARIRYQGLGGKK